MSYSASDVQVKRCMHLYIHTCTGVHKYILYIHTYMYIHIHVHVQVYINIYREANIEF